MSQVKNVVRSESALEKIKETLLERKRELEEQLSNLSKEKMSDGQVQDVGDQALSSIMESLRSSLQNAEVEEYKRIIKAIEMIENGVYGVCEDCSKAISEKRLKLFPNAYRCLICQEAAEEVV